MAGGTVINSTKGIDQRQEPQISVPAQEMSVYEAMAFEFIDKDRQEYVLEHAPRILSALIIRREGTKPKELVGKAIEAACLLYDRVVKPVVEETDPKHYSDV